MSFFFFLQSLTEPNEDKSQGMLKHLSYVYQITTDMTQLQVGGVLNQKINANNNNNGSPLNRIGT